MGRTSGDWFIDLFLKEAERIIDKLKSRDSIGSRIEPKEWWIPGLPSPANKGLVAAVDGGAGLQPLSGGGGIYIARAFGYIPGDQPSRRLIARLYPVREAKLLEAMRMMTEHTVLLDLAKRVPSNSIILVDGSLWALLTSVLSMVLRALRRRITSLALPYALKTLQLLGNALETANRRNVIVAYVSKDYSYSVLKEIAIAWLMTEAGLAPKKAIEHALEWYPATRRLASLAGSWEPARRLLDRSYNDGVFIEDSIGASTGYTKPIRIPPLRGLVERIASKGVRTLVEESCSMLAEDEPELECNPKDLAEVLDRLPSSKAIYVKLSAYDKPLLVELPVKEVSYYMPGRWIEEPGPYDTRIVEALVAEYGGPYYYNTSLIVAHINATLSEQQIAYYMRILEEIAASRGLVLPLPRRSTSHWWRT
ncbi:MAG: DNA double-strand break repair nuclease NurA [Pyrodictiaceae archaeon]